MFYISPTTKEGMACEGRGRNCPGVSGAFRFDPPLAGRMDFKLDEAPGYLPPGLTSYAVTVGLAVLALCCLTCVFTMDTSTKSLLPGYLPPGLASYAVTVGLAVLALCCLTCVF